MNHVVLIIYALQTVYMKDSEVKIAFSVQAVHDDADDDAWTRRRASNDRAVASSSSSSSSSDGTVGATRGEDAYEDE